MFTGIIESSGRIIRLRPDKSNLQIFVESSISNELKVDQSVAHDGVCLTIDELGPDWHRCTLIRETLEKTHFSGTKKGDRINLERSIRFDSRIDGHFVQGHTDTTLACLASSERNGSWVFEFELPSVFKALVIPKGSIALNGVSLTISALKADRFEVSIIPYTFEHTNFQLIRPGNRVNAEFDLLGKYIQRSLELQGSQGLR